MGGLPLKDVKVFVLSCNTFSWVVRRETRSATRRASGSEGLQKGMSAAGAARHAALRGVARHFDVP